MRFHPSMRQACLWCAPLIVILCLSLLGLAKLRESDAFAKHTSGAHPKMRCFV
jgi:hypothetical protein